MWKKIKTTHYKSRTTEPCLARLKKALDREFSLFIRLRDCDGKNGIGNCISCGSPIQWNNCDAGHFISRNRLSTRYNERNVNAQCKKCNRFESGRQFEHGIAIDRKYGSKTAELLLNLSKMATKYTAFDYEYKIGNYKSKIKEMG